MITKDLASFAEENWTAYKKPVSVISRSNRKKAETALVMSALEMFDFDMIVEELFGRGKCKSADAFYVGRADAFGDKKDIVDGLPKKDRTRICLYLIEFKRYDAKARRPEAIRPCDTLEKEGFPGLLCSKDALKAAFYRELERLDETECPIVRKLTGKSAVCDKRSLLRERREAREKELADSIRLKAIEGYTILQRAFFPLCADAAPRKLIYCVVIGMPAVKEEIGILNGLTQKKRNKRSQAKESASCPELEQALNRLKVRISVQDPKYAYVYQNPYIYDAVRLVTPLRFLAQTRDILASQGT